MDTTAIEQNTILRDILNTLKSSAGGGGGSGSNVPYYPGAATNAFDRSRNMFDAMLSSKWMELGWADAYKSQLNSSISQDAFGALGWNRSPNVMTQLEYQRMSMEAFNNRIGMGIGHLIAPQFTNKVNDLGNTIFSNSNRFMWAGDANTSIFGSGMNFGAASALSRTIMTGAIKDLRLSQSDYGTVVNSGLVSGQYDFVKSTGDFLNKTKELAQAVGDLTRTMHMGVDEVAQSMGNLRKFGIVDVADQSRVMRQIGGMAQASGLNTASAIQAWDGAAAVGQQYGIAANTAGMMGLANVSQVRAMARGGIVPQYMIAAGGGAEGIASHINAAQMRFAAGPGYYAMLGGAGFGGNGDFMRNYAAGVSTAGGSLANYFNSEFGKAEFMETLKDNPERLRNLHKQNIAWQIRKQLGRGDDDALNDVASRNAAFMLTRGEMGDEAARVFAIGNFTEGGQLESSRQSWRESGAVGAARRRLEADTYYENNSFGGTLRKAQAQVNGIPARFVNWVNDKWQGNGNTGFFVSPMDQSLAAGSLGAMPYTGSQKRLFDVIKSGRLDGAMRSLEFETPNDAAYYGAAAAELGGYAGTAGLAIAGGMGGAAAGAWAGAKFGAVAGSFVPGLGNVVGGLVGAAAGGAAGLFIKNNIMVPGATYASNAMFGPASSIRLEGRDADSYKAFYTSISSSTETVSNETGSRLFKNEKFQALLKTTSNTDTLVGSGALKKAEDVKAVARDAGVSEAVVIKTAAKLGKFLDFSAGRLSLSANMEKVNTEYRDVMDTVMKGTTLTGIDGGDGAFGEIIKDIISAPDAESRAKAEGRLGEYVGEPNRKSGSYDIMIANLSRMTRNTVQKSFWGGLTALDDVDMKKAGYLGKLNAGLDGKARAELQTRFESGNTYIEQLLKSSGRTSSAAKYKKAADTGLGFAFNALDDADKAVLKNDTIGLAMTDANDLTLDDFKNYRTSPRFRHINTAMGGGDNSDMLTQLLDKLGPVTTEDELKRARLNAEIALNGNPEVAKQAEQQKAKDHETNIASLLSQAAQAFDRMGVKIDKPGQ